MLLLSNWRCLFIHWTLSPYTEPGQHTHVVTRIVIFRLSGKEPDENVIVNNNIDQNNFCKGGGPKYLFCPGPNLTSSIRRENSLGDVECKMTMVLRMLWSIKIILFICFAWRILCFAWRILMQITWWYCLLYGIVDRNLNIITCLNAWSTKLVKNQFIVIFVHSWTWSHIEEQLNTRWRPFQGLRSPSAFLMHGLQCRGFEQTSKILYNVCYDIVLL